MQETLEKEMATHSSILAWEIPLTEEPAGLHCMGSQSVGHDLASKQQQKEQEIISHVLWQLICQMQN